MAEMRDRLDAPILAGVGAAFDFHAGLVPQAPAWMQRRGLEWAYRLMQRAAPPVAALRALQPAVRRRVRPPVRRSTGAPERRRAASLSRRMRYDVSVIGLGRVGLPLALELRRPRAERPRHRQRPRAPARAARAAHAVRGARRPGAARPRARPPAACAATASRDAAQRRRTSSSRSARRRSRTSRSTCATSAPRSTTCCRVLRPGHALVPALDRRARHDRLRRRLPRQAPRLQVGEDVFVAHVPERIAAGRFFEEIATLPCIVGGVGERSGEVARRSCSRSSARRSCRRRRSRPSWRRSGPTSCATRTFALPNLLMMDCEQYGANVFEVIDLINRDYPRGGMAPPGLTAGTCLRKDFAFSEERSDAPGHAARRLPRQRVACRCFLVEGMKRRARHAARPEGRRARPRLQGATPTTSATRSRTSSSACSSASWPTSRSTTRTCATPTSSFDEAVRDADAVVVATNHAEFCDAGRAARRSREPARARGARRRPVELLRRRPGVRLRRRDPGADRAARP